MANTIIKGTDLMLFYSGHSIAYATSTSLSLNAETKDVSSKDHGNWTAKTAGKLSWTVSSDNLYTTQDYSTMMDYMITRQPLTVVFALKSATGATAENISGTTAPISGWSPLSSNGYTGSAIITSIQASAPDNENATYSISMDGTGVLSKV